MLARVEDTTSFLFTKFPPTNINLFRCPLPGLYLVNQAIDIVTTNTTGTTTIATTTATTARGSR